jgi:hypothetical protein
MSFHSILEQKIRSQRTQDSQTFTSHSARPADQDPAHLAFLMGALQRTAFSRPVTTLYPSAPKPPPPPHLLSESQQVAYGFLVAHGGDLGPAFTQKQLRTAFRRAALRLHPDMNKGTSGPFIELKKYYAELGQLFAAPTAATESI